MVVFITTSLFFGCQEEKISKLTVFFFPKLLLPDSSLVCKVKDTVIKDTLFVELSISNKSSNPVYIPLNNWYVDGWPIVSSFEFNPFENSFPDYNKTYSCNTFLFCNGTNWDKTQGEFAVPMINSYPVIKKLDSDKTTYFKLKIINNEFIYNNIKKLKIRGNIIYSNFKNHKRLIDILNISEDRILNKLDTIRFSFNLSNNPRNVDSLNPYHGIPNVYYNDITNYSFKSFYSDKKEYPLVVNLMLFRKLYIYFYRLGFLHGEYYLVESFNESLKKFISNPKEASEKDSGIDLLRNLYDCILSETYCYSVKFKNY